MNQVQVLSSKTLKTYKNRKLNTANFGDFSRNDYEVFLHLITKISGVDEYGRYLQPEKLAREYCLTAKEFNEVFEVSLANCYGILKRAVDKLIKTDISVEMIDTQEVWRINICSMAKYNKSEGLIKVKFTDDIMPYLAQVQRKFVLYNLKEIANFNSLYTTRLYELIQEFKETGWMRKSVDQLRKIFAVGDKFKLYGHFKKNTFSHACQEINDNYEMNLSFKELKQGRKVVAVEFTFKKTKIYKAINQKTGKQQNIYEKPALKSKIIESGIGQLHSSINTVKKIGDVTSNLPIFKDISTL